ncbi:MAG: sugar transferase, partial [Patescibacteria group bacterium]|nr:sugar transferase [Patescibacteria group bacterium]
GLIRAQIANIAIATAFFYLIPWYGISPKTTLFVYLLISLGLILGWRFYGYRLVAPRSRERVIVIGSGREAREIVDSLPGQSSETGVVVYIDASKTHDDIFSEIKSKRATLIIADLHDQKVQELMSKLYNLLFEQVRFIDMDRVYEEMFGRVPLSLVRHNWFLENISTAPKAVYDSLKRLMDIIVSVVLGAISLVAYPFVALAIKIEDKGPVFILQERIGRGDRVIRIIKFRSMSVASQDSTGASKPQSVTRVGAFIRKTRIDELPQLWNVIKGDLSLIGPRPELPQFVRMYEAEIPFYKIRHVIQPGLSGWAQIYHKTPPKFAASSEDTAAKLSYDLYYIKNRSLILDLNIALRTIGEVLSRKGV